jgi:hypothetical protein
MSRSTVVFTMTTLALFAGLGTAAAQTPAPTQTPCTVVTGKRADVSVDGNAVADPDCLTVAKKKTTVVWTGTTDVKTLTITFKDRSTKHPPDDPQCSGAQCTSDKLKLDKVGSFDYSVVVVRQDGSTASVDPKLIIQP